MRFVVVGEGFPAVKVVETLRDHLAEIAAVYTGDNPGRLQALGAASDIPLLRFDDLKSTTACEQMHGFSPDWLINANSTVLLSKDILAIPKQGALNLHPGLLPEYAGLHTHQWAIRNGEVAFGATVHFMEPSVDVGDIVGVRRFPIQAKDTGLSLFNRCIAEGTALLGEIVEALMQGRSLGRNPQDLNRRRLYRHRDALDARIDWRWTAREVANFVRAGNYEPFQTPTYSATVDPTAQFPDPPVILRAGVGAHYTLPCGSILTQDGRVKIVCGDGVAIDVERSKIGAAVMDVAAWDQYIASLPHTRLCGRMPAPSPGR